MTTTTEKIMTWNEMVESYPDMWVVVKNAEMQGPDILSGIVVKALSDEDIIQFRLNNTRKDYEICRTTEGAFNGIIDSDLSITIN